MESITPSLKIVFLVVIVTKRKGDVRERLKEIDLSIIQLQSHSNEPSFALSK